MASRVKILSDMDISERRAPQDGRFIVRIANRRVDLRVSTLPTQYGEKVVMRLLESDAPLKNFEALGFPQQLSEHLKRLLELPQGMILVTGPTGSGKSTTLYGSLNYVRKPSINIVTVEDPVEYVVPGLNQVQVNTKAGLTFATSLRSILRQDPDVIMVGEIRDAETAEIAMKAAQTGHLVLSTLHTNDSVGAVTRLRDIGVPGYQIAAALTSIVAQRVVRRLCVCRRKIPATPEFVSQVMRAGAAAPPETQTIPTGCDDCDLTGYKGRIGIYEMLVLTPGVRDAVREGGRNDEIRSLARRGGMKFMHECALDRVAEGTTTLEEVQRVVPMDFRASANCAACGWELSESSLVHCPPLRRERSATAKHASPSKTRRKRTRSRPPMPGSSQTRAAQGKAHAHRGRAFAFQSLRNISLNYEGHSERLEIRPPDLQQSLECFITTQPQSFPEGAVLNLTFRLVLTAAELRARGEVRYCPLPGVGLWAWSSS